jgi:hypothetical protein
MGLLGVGQLVTEYEARPWLNRARRHTKALFGWGFIHRIHFNNGAVPVSARQQRLMGAPAAKPQTQAPQPGQGQPARP